MVSFSLGVLQPLKKNENETMLEAELLGRNATWTVYYSNLPLRAKCGE
jgi:hypothetical protein